MVSWGSFDASWEHLGEVVGGLGSVLGSLGVCWEPLGGVVGPLYSTDPESFEGFSALQLMFH